MKMKQLLTEETKNGLRDLLRISIEAEDWERVTCLGKNHRFLLEDSTTLDIYERVTGETVPDEIRNPQKYGGELFDTSKSPISYWGGKKQMIPIILPLIPKHEHFVEAFAGGLAIMWAKPPSKYETINDINGEVINFWTQLRDNFTKLNAEIQWSLLARDVYIKAQTIYAKPAGFSPIDRAWAFWYVSNFSFGNNLKAGICASHENKVGMKLHNKKLQFRKEYSDRFKRVNIENIDALTLIKRRDHKEAFFFADPPYMNADQGHYEGYTERDFFNLLTTLEKIEGKFLLSCYWSPEIEHIASQNNWSFQAIEMNLSAGKCKRGDKRRKKIEFLIRNYDL
jgi:DNA adenine methylase